MNTSLYILHKKIEEYKAKFYKNQLIKGGLLAVSLLISAFIFVNFIEYFGRFGSLFRGVLLFAFVGLALYTLVYLIGLPLIHFMKMGKRVSSNEAAADIGKFFPGIGDKLLNTLQLSQNTVSDDALLLASIEQKSSSLKFYHFSDAINFKDNRKYLKYCLPPLVILLFISAISPHFFESSERIINFRQAYVEDAPFSFNLLNEDLKAYRNEDFKLNLSLEGGALPEEVFLVYNDRRFRMNIENRNTYSYTFTKLQQNVDFNFLASGFESKGYELSLINRPEMLSFDIIATYPSYLGKEAESLENVGNLIVPEGTRIRWLFNTQFADSLFINLSSNIKGKNSSLFKASQNNVNQYSFTYQASESSDYNIVMSNNQAFNNESIAYYINVIPDLLPQIRLEQIKDTALYNYIALGGAISDDYGISKFTLKYKQKNNVADNFKSVDIDFSKNQLSQTFFHQFDLGQLGLEREDEIEYYLELWDNDGVNGAKSVKTSIMTFGMPSSKEFDEEVDKQVESTEDQMEKLLRESKELKKDLADLDKDLKSKKKLDFQDNKRLEELLKKRDEMLKDLKDLQKQFDRMQEKQNRFDKQSPETSQKMEKLQELLNQLMQEEENKLFDELEQMMENKEEQKIQDQIEKMKQQDRNLDKDLDRALKLFKQMQLKQKVEQTAKELEKLADKQEELGKKTEENKDIEKNKELKKEQEKLSKEFDEKKEKMKDIEKLSKELRKDMDAQKEEQEKTSEEQKKSEDQLEKNENSESGKSQKKAAKSMRSMAAKMSTQMQSAEMKQMDIDMEALRALLENLIKLSFDQETTMKNLKGISRTDPRFVELSQQQLKLTDDAQVIEDSLYSLAQRVMQIDAFVTKEVTKMKNSMDQSIQHLKERELPRAAAQQQFSMTSINNLALLLSDTFKQMQEMMAMAMPGSGKGNKQESMPSPGLGKQQQELNEKIKGLGQRGQKPSDFSKELAKMANEQAKIRKQLRDMQEALNGTEEGKILGEKLKKLQNEMDKSENEIVNKRINPELIKRQVQIETRLLEVEKAVKEQELDNKRKSKTAIGFQRESPPSLESFMKEKEKQLELIRTTPASFTPFYKQETDNYFRRIK
ncbi:MAG: hypothetical protein ACI9IP_000271 [Arcticibacterium sp.]|jgi:hypothetical protein